MSEAANKYIRMWESAWMGGPRWRRQAPAGRKRRLGRRAREGASSPFCCGPRTPGERGLAGWLARSRIWINSHTSCSRVSRERRRFWAILRRFLLLLPHSCSACGQPAALRALYALDFWPCRRRWRARSRGAQDWRTLSGPWFEPNAAFWLQNNFSSQNLFFAFYIRPKNQNQLGKGQIFLYRAMGTWKIDKTIFWELTVLFSGLPS